VTLPGAADAEQQDLSSLVAAQAPRDPATAPAAQSERRPRSRRCTRPSRGLPDPKHRAGFVILRRVARIPLLLIFLAVVVLAGILAVGFLFNALGM
jgi:hypothetical protein